MLSEFHYSQQRVVFDSLRPIFDEEILECEHMHRNQIYGNEKRLVYVNTRTRMEFWKWFSH